MALKYCYSGAVGAGTGADWANAYTTFVLAAAGMVAGDSLAVANDHAETQASAMTMTFPGTQASPNLIYCVSRAGSVPPVSADLATTATVSTTGNSAMALQGTFYCYGVTFTCGSGAVAPVLTICNTLASQTYASCGFVSGGTNATISVIGGGGYRVIWSNTTWKVSAATSTLRPVTGLFIWRNTPTAIQGATIPTSLFAIASSGQIFMDGVDLSALTTGKTIVPTSATNIGVIVTLKDCKLDSAVTKAATPNNVSTLVDFIRSASSGNFAHDRFAYGGTQTVDTTVYRTGGASDGVTSISWKLTSTANASYTIPFDAMPITIFNPVVNSNVIATVHGVWNAAALPNNDQVWVSVAYLGSATSPQASFKSGAKADILAAATALTASTQAWDSGVLARINTTGYNLGDIIKVASNAGRIFFCTTAGTSSGSEPVGYASAVDGGNVTDGTAVFRAAVRFSQSITLTSPQPQQPGRIYITPRVGAASLTFYVDPKPVLS